ncbi:MAG: SusC/RagA family TonB-linked outer membrane protein [Saprospirales bacterium]|nr:SusC/RagA family TonB-linked outer membrane protein [Saprospirales bacterium]MBK8922814.1 SusC/RagA family TonB-linked outer membrane protein [Saprospirales bacterium]
MKQLNVPGSRRWLLALGFILFACFLGAPLYAQMVSGKVIDAATGEALLGVTISETGTRNGTITDVNGAYSLRLTNANATLNFSIVGYSPVSLAVNGQATLDVAMESGTNIDEVVVTALGIRKESKKVGYSVTQVDGSSLTQARETNVINSLTGRVAGLNVSGTVSGPAGSSRITLRGNTSISGDNQPLFVINGVPMDNSNLGSAGLWGGADFGDGISSLNADDIETMTVLKGATAAALYGSRAKNGVILITTKGGKARKGIGVEWTSNLQLDQPLIFSDWQQEYGQGTLGAAPATASEGLNTGLSSWGGKLNGQPSFQFDGVQHPYSAQGIAAKDFYQTGLTHINTLALESGTEALSARFSLSHLGNTGIVPAAELERQNFHTGINIKQGRLSAELKANYTRERAERNNLSDSPGNPNFAISFLPANVDQSLLAGEDGEGSERDGSEQEFNDNGFITNPYFAAYKFINRSAKDRLLGSATIRYDLADWLYIQGRIGQDFISNRITTVTPTGTEYNPAGNMNENSLRLSERNLEGLIGIDHAFSENFGINAAVGANRMDRRSENINANGGTFVIPYLYSLGNTTSRNFGYGLDRWRTNSVFGFAEFDFYHQFYLNITGRNDWYSTLVNPSYFYPSVSASWVFTEAIETSFFNYGKVRAAYASVGGDTRPYQTQLYYNIGGTINGNPLGNIANGSIPNKDLQPLSITELEAGLDLRFLNNRVGLDFTWYNKKTENDIVSASISGTSGYGSAVFNLGEVKNTGIEVLLSVDVLKGRRFSWTSSLNLAKNNSEVVALAGELQTLQVDGSRTLTAFVHQTVGLSFANIKAFDYKRDDQGRILLTGGLPQQGDLLDMGSGVHDLTGGWNNDFQFGNFRFGALVDFKFGGKIFSATNAYAYQLGVHQETLVGREDGIVAAGIDAATGEANTIKVTAQEYYGALDNISSLFVYDASFIKLRQVTLGYSLPASLVQRWGIQGITISAVGRNLAILMKKTDNIDPESNYNNSNAQGLELAGLPTTRSLGLALSVKF